MRTWNSTAKKYEYALASYTVEVNGEKAADGMSSLLVTTFEAETTAHDVVNSRVQPMVTAEEQHRGHQHRRHGRGVEPLRDQQLPGVPGRAEHPDRRCDVHSDGSCTIKECETVEGEISKNNAAWRIVLAGLVDGASWANQRTAYGWSEKHEAVDANGRPTTETVTGTFDYDFAIGQNQNAMNAGFVPPDRSSLVGQAWYDEDYDGKNDSDTSDDRIDTDDRDKTEQGVEGLRVILTQYYFVPTYDNHGNQLLEDEDNNVFFLDTRPGQRRLSRTASCTLVEIARRATWSSGADDKVYLVRSGRTYDYDALYKAGVRELKDSGYWVENTNLNGGRQYKDGEDVEVPETPTTSTDPENSGETTDPETRTPRTRARRPIPRTRAPARVATPVAIPARMRASASWPSRPCAASRWRGWHCAATEDDRGLRRRREHRGDRPGRCRDLHPREQDLYGQQRTAPTTGRATPRDCTASATNEACSDGDGDGTLRRLRRLPAPARPHLHLQGCRRPHRHLRRLQRGAGRGAPCRRQRQRPVRRLRRRCVQAHRA